MKSLVRLLLIASIVLAGAVSCSSIRQDELPAVSGDEPVVSGEEAVHTLPVLQSFGIGGDFVLDAHDGSVFDLAAHRGEVFLLFFGYTRCPDFCPATLSLLAQVSERLGARADEMTTLFVSIDPQHDEPERVGEYLSYFGVRAIGLTGSAEQVEELVAAYAGVYEIASESEAGPIFGHSTYTYLIDSLGHVRYMFRSDDRPQFIADGVIQVLDEAAR